MRAMNDPGQMPLFRRTIHGMSWQSGSIFLLGILQIGVLAILARHLAPRDFGLAALVSVLVTVTTSAFQMGLGPAIIHRKNLSPDDLGFVFLLTVLTGVAGAGAFWIVAPGLARFFGWPELKPMLPVAGLAVFVSNLALVSNARLQKEMDFKVLSLLDVGAYAAGALLTLLLALRGHGAWSIILGLLARLGVKSAGCLLVRPPVVVFHLARCGVKSILGYGGALTLTQVMNQAAQQGDNLIVGRLLGAAALGFYDRAFFLMTVSAQYFGRVLDSVMFPAMAQIQDKNKRLGTGYLAAVSTLNSILLPVSLIGIVLAREIIGVLMGPQWTASIAPFQILLLALSLRTTVRCADSLARATGRVGQNARVKSIYAAFVIGLALASSPWGIVGVAIGVTAANFIHYFLMLALVRSAIGVSWREQFGAHVPGLFLGLLALLLCLAGRAVTRGLHFPDLGVLAVSGLLAAAGVGCLIFAFPRILGEGSLWLVRRLLAKANPERGWVRRFAAVPEGE